MQKEFNILLRHRIPFITRGSFALIGGFVLILLILWIFMLPADGSSSSLEMKTAYYILAVPEGVKYLAAFALLSLLILIPLNLIRLRIPSILTISDHQLAIQNKRLRNEIKFSSIKKISVYDATNSMGQTKFRLHIEITYDYDKRIIFLLTNYGDADDLMQSLGNIDPDKFRFYDKYWPGIDES